MLTAVTGINWGDEGKGRVIDLLAENTDIVAVAQGTGWAGRRPPCQKGQRVRLYPAWHRLRLQRQVPQKDPASGRPFASGRAAHPEPPAHDPGRQEHGAGGLLPSGAHELRCPAELVQAAGGVLCALYL